MKKNLRNTLALLAALSFAPISASAQFRDLSTRPNTDTTAINEFIKSYQRQMNPLYVHQIDGPRFGPLSGFRNRQFIADNGEVLPLDSAKSLVSLGSSWLLCGAIGGGLGTIASIAAVASVANDISSTSNNAPPSTPVWVIVAGPTVGFVVGALIGLLIPHEENAAPMNAFRTR
jgi:hypothetical protein